MSNLSHRMRFVPGLAAVAAASLMATQALAGTFTGITNGNFASNTANYTSNGVNIGTSFTNSDVTGWNVTGCLANCQGILASSDTFNAIVNTATVGTAGIQYSLADLNGGVKFWSGAAGTAPSTYAATSDAATQTAAIYQTVSNLTIGDTYLLSFAQATIEATDGNGAFSAKWNVYFGTGSASSALSTYANANGSVMTNAGQTGSAWNTDTLSFVATAASETLSFFATASTGQPPFLLLDNVSLSDQGPSQVAAVPEPASLALLATGLLGMMIIRRRKSGNEV